MNQLKTTAIILSRIDYGEADRIITLLTPDHGKLSLLARGVRRAKSKMAGGIELFSISDITYMKGRGELGTLISTRLSRHYGTIVQDINRVQTGYELIKMLHRATEDQPEAEYFELLQQAFAALDNPEIDLDLINLWFQAQLLRFSGHEPNLLSEKAGTKLQSGHDYNFDFDSMSFEGSPHGNFTPDHIKTIRLLFSGNPPHVLAQVQGTAKMLYDLTPLIHAMLTSYIRV